MHCVEVQTSDEPVSIPTAFIQTAASTEERRLASVKKAVFLQKAPVRDEDQEAADYETALNQLRAHNKQMGMKSVVLTSVISSLSKRDPLKKVRVMIKNLVQRLKDEAQNEQNRNEYCSTEETAKQEARLAKKKGIKQFETGLEKAQGAIAESRAALKALEESISEAKKTCAKQNGEYNFAIHNHQNNVAMASHGVDSLHATMADMKSFYGDAAQADVESGYTGNTNAAQGIVGMMEGLRDDFQKTLDTATEEANRLTTEQSEMITSTVQEVQDKREQERQEISTELSPALEKFKTNGASLYQTVQEYSLLTEELIVLKYDSEACSDTQLSKEEEAANKEAEISALKDALEVLNNHGAN